MLSYVDMVLPVGFEPTTLYGVDFESTALTTRLREYLVLRAGLEPAEALSQLVLSQSP